MAAQVHSFDCWNQRRERQQKMFHLMRPLTPNTDVGLGEKETNACPVATQALISTCSDTVNVNRIV